MNALRLGPTTGEKWSNQRCWRKYRYALMRKDEKRRVTTNNRGRSHRLVTRPPHPRAVVNAALEVQIKVPELLGIGKPLRRIEEASRCGGAGSVRRSGPKRRNASSLFDRDQ